MGSEALLVRPRGEVVDGGDRLAAEVTGRMVRLPRLNGAQVERAAQHRSG